MNLQECYRLLNINETASNEELTSSFKRLAQKYHPDKNRDRIEWANRAMADINVAYTTIMGVRFRDSSSIPDNDSEQEDVQKERTGKPQQEMRRDTFRETIPRDILIERFVKLREASKDALYRYFQFGLNNMVRRDQPANRSKFKEVVTILKKSFHSVERLSKLTRDDELLEHFSIFNQMIFNFYKASECWNLLDSYSNIIDVEAYRLYIKGDEALHLSHSEIFYDRHNRGSFKRENAVTYLLEAEYHFKSTLERFSNSTWTVESRIKLDYVQALKNYLNLFFTE